MRSFRLLCFAAVLTAAFSMPAFAGDVPCPPAPDPGDMSTPTSAAPADVPGPGSAAPGIIDTPTFVALVSALQAVLLWDQLTR